MATFLSQEDRECGVGEDRISGLPDDIILSFLSLMGMKEAAKTSVLSKRWRSLWAKRTHLDFDYLCILPQLDPCQPTSSEKSKYINWVNQVLGWQQSELHYSIDTFRVRFPLHLHSSEAHHVDKWVKFAVSRKVKNLELNSTSWSVIYTLGFDILENPSLDITCLTSLHLNSVDVSGDFIEFLLSKKCHHLERLYVDRSRILRRLKVIGLVCKLKRLAICDCRELKEVEIVDADNLMYFDFIGWNWDTKLVLKSMPMLVEAAFSRIRFEPPVSIFQRISHLAPHISKLFLDSTSSDEFPTVLPETLPTFCNLKHLNMVVQYSPLSENILDIPHLLDACPALRELKLEVNWFGYNSRGQSFVVDAIEKSGGDDDLEAYLNYFLSEQEQEQEQPKRKNHPNLKRVQVVGFGGCNYEVSTILSIMRCASNLDTIICDPNRRPDDMWDGVDDVVLATSRARAHLFAKIIPPHITLLIM